jgi:hypothetical protein
MDVIWWATAAVGAIGINLIASELFAWGPRLSEWLMRSAVRRLAPEMQERMQEEWAGHLQTIPPGLWRVVSAAGFYLAARQINVALRVRERPENPGRRWKLQRAVEDLDNQIALLHARVAALEEKTPQEKPSRKLPAKAIIAFALADLVGVVQSKVEAAIDWLETE